MRLRDRVSSTTLIKVSRTVKNDRFCDKKGRPMKEGVDAAVVKTLSLTPIENLRRIRRWFSN